MPSAESLLSSLEAAFGRPLQLVWTDNGSTYFSLRPPLRGGPWTLRLHQCFRPAPEPIWAGLAAFLRTRRRSHLERVRDYFVAHRPARTRTRRSLVLRPAGGHHHVGRILSQVSDVPLFAGLPPTVATWGSRREPGGRCVRLGSYRRAEDGAPTPAVIRVHRVLDAARVPDFVVGAVLHHEMVHHLLTVREGAEAGRLHGREFQRLEALFPGHHTAERWLEVELPRLL